MVSPEESAALYRACRSAEPRAHGPAYVRLAAILLPVARRQLDDPAFGQLAEDCTQEVLRKVWQTLRSDHDIRPESFVAFCISATVHCALDEARRLNPVAATRGPRRVPAKSQVSLDGPGREGRDVAESVADPGGIQPDDLHERFEIHRALACIGEAGRVSDRSRIVILKGFLEDWSDSELAEHLSTTRNNIQQIRHHDLGRLRSDRTFIGRLAGFYPAVRRPAAAERDAGT